VNEAADWLGPRYDAAKGRDFLMDAIKTHRPDEGDMFGKIQRLSHNNQKRLFSEIHPDSKVLGAGSEGIAFGVPGGSVTRVGTSMSPFGGGYFSFANSGVPIAGRARIPEMLQPIRSNDFGGLANGIRVENLHRVMPMDDEVDALRGMMMRVNDKPGAREAGYALENTHYLNDDLAAHLMGSIEKAHPGLNAWDVAPRNVSTTPQGRLIVHDPSAVASTQVSFIPYHTARRPDEAMGMGLLRQGAPEDLRQAIARTAAEGPVGQGVEFPARTVDARGRIVDPGGERAKHLAHIRDFLVSSGSIPQGQSLFEAIMKHRGG
jgi:hypothetical protein